MNCYGTSGDFWKQSCSWNGGLGFGTLSSAEVQAFVISIRCAKCTAVAKRSGGEPLPDDVDFSYILVVFSYIDGFLGFG